MRPNGAAVPLCLLAGLAAASPAPPGAGTADPGARVLARINGEALYAEDVASLLGEIHRRPEMADREHFDNERLLFRLVNDALLAQEARALKMDEEQALRHRLAQARASRARERLYREEIGDRIVVSEESLEAVYEDVYRTATLTVLSRRDAGEARALRDEVLAAKDADALAALARTRSQDPYAGRGGRMKSVALLDLYETMVEFATTASPGEVSPPTVTPFGWSILRLEQLSAADPELATKRRSKTVAVLRYRRDRELRAELIPRLKERFPVTVDAEAVAAIEVQRMHDGRLVPKVDRPERVALHVGERRVSSATLGGALADAWQDVGNPLVAEKIRTVVVDDIVFDELLAAEAQRRGYDATPEVEREMHALETRLLVERYLQETVASGVAVDRAEMVAYYEEHRDQFRRPPKLHLLQLTVPTEAAARRTIEQARAGADFGWLVAQHSTDAFRESGGDRGWMAANSGPPPFHSELATAEAGDLLGPKAWDGEWVVAKVDVVEDQGTYAFDEVSGNVRARLTDQRMGERVDTTIRKLRERSEIWIAEDAAEMLGLSPVQATPAPESGGHSR